MKYFGDNSDAPPQPRWRTPEEVRDSMPKPSPRRPTDPEPANWMDWPDPTPEMLTSPEFEAVWQCIKRWDINVPEAYAGYSGATGNHVRAILDALAIGRTCHRPQQIRNRAHCVKCGKAEPMSIQDTPNVPIWNRLNINTANAYQQTTTAWAQARAFIYMQDAADQHNANLVTEYGIQWARYKQDRDNQPAAMNINPPYPATAQSVDVMANGWPETVDSTALVCSPNVYQPPKIIADTHGMAFTGAGSVSTVDIFAGVNLGGIVTRPDTTKWVRIA